MSTYELDDDLVGEFLNGSKGTWARLVNVLAEQLPIPVPTKLGAVVRTEDGALWVRAGLGSDAQRLHYPWRKAAMETRWCHADQLPRVVKVLSEGVDVPDTDD